MRVTWIKPMFGFAVTDIMGGTDNVAADLNQMGQEVASTDDVVAVYIAEDAPADIGWSDYRGCIAGYAALAPMPQGRSVHDYPVDGIPGHDRRWRLGWPVATWVQYPTNSLKLGPWISKICGEDCWRRLYTTFQGGRPVKLEDRYRPFADALSGQFERTKARLQPLTPHHIGAPQR